MNHEVVFRRNSSSSFHKSLNNLVHKSFSDVFFKCRRRLACLWDDKMSRSSFRIWTSWILPPHPHIWKKKEVYFHDLLLSARLFNIRISAVDFSCLLQSISLVTRSGWAWHPDDLLNVTQWPDDDLLITVSHPWVRPPSRPKDQMELPVHSFMTSLMVFYLRVSRNMW